jgi:hypothetical protein
MGRLLNFNNRSLKLGLSAGGWGLTQVSLLLFDEHTKIYKNHAFGGWGKFTLAISKLARKFHNY